jgi:hypothetical protein
MGCHQIGQNHFGQQMHENFNLLQNTVTEVSVVERIKKDKVCEDFVVIHRMGIAGSKAVPDNRAGVDGTMTILDSQVVDNSRSAIAGDLIKRGFAI